jgi:alkanesulfonate monooxygenase SsuD/methylene tetrahydromethanopterin reductase-like flavin-dependent oxidoreductase (luciferase family)
MDIGIGLPNTVLEVDRAGIVDWARRADAAGFSSLGTIDRLVYPNYEPLITLAAAAAVTERIRLLTDILIAPLHSNAALLAKQVATIDGLSQGRMVLGMAVGGRPDDYAASEVEMGRRGRIFDEQLQTMTSVWAGEQGIGPAPFRGSRPNLLIGGTQPRSFARVARYADGWTSGGGGPDAFAATVPAVRQAWSDAGRDGSPRTVALAYFGLGDAAATDIVHTVGSYYAFAGPYRQMAIDGAAAGPAAVRAIIDGYRAAGADELVLFPTSADPTQVDRLAEVAFGSSTIRPAG